MTAVLNPPLPDFRVLFESAPGLYLVLTPDLIINAVSNAYLTATITERHAIVGREIFEVFPDNPDDPTASGVSNLRISLEHVRQFRESNAMAVQRYDIRRPASEGGGFEQRFWSPVNSPVLHENGDLAYIIHSVEDVTEFVRLKQLGSEQDKLTEELRSQAQRMEAEVYRRAQEVSEVNRRLSKANAQLEQLYQQTLELDQLKSDFFANVSHELRTPLALIIGPTEKLINTSDTTDEIRRSLQTILRNARLLLSHVNDLLDASKLEAGKMGINFFEVDVARLVRLTVAHFASFAEERQINFSVAAEGSLIAQVDYEKLQRILLNLLSNAFKFTPDRGRISCGLHSTHDALMLTVADSGPGIPIEHREVVFERFRQLEGSARRSHGGTGLGLAITREFVELHGGKVSIEDAPEGGALFRVQLPLYASPGTSVTTFEGEEAVGPSEADVSAVLASSRARSASGTASIASAEMKSARVLVIEDNPDMNQFVCESLTADYLVDSAMNGREGLEKALTLRPDIIISDIMMPEMSGDELLKEIRSRSEFDATPVLLLSAKADDQVRLSLLQTGANDYLMKPFSVAELLARVNNLVAFKIADDANKQLQSELKRANEELKAFSYSVSHDLRSPLRAINGFSAMLLEDFGADLPEEGRRTIGVIRETAGRMNRLIEDLLAFCSLSQQPLQMQMVEMTLLARAVAEEALVQDRERGIDLVIADLPPVNGDPILLRQVWANLLGNAVKYTRGCDQAVIRVTGEPVNGEMVYAISDNGAGFDMAHAGKLFGVFQRLHSRTDFEGTGIGLSIVHRIIQRHGGRVWAAAEVGKGATFHFTIPKQVASEAQKHMKEPALTW